MYISVIIPTYNDSPERLKKSVDSVLTQTYQNFELIVVDDGGNNPFSGLAAIISDPRITWLKLEKNQGPAAARNRGVEISQGEYIAFLDAGDWWEKEKLEEQIKLFNQGAGDFVFAYCGARIFTPHCDVPSNKVSGQIPSAKDLLISNKITGSASSVMIKKTYFEKVGGFDELTQVTEDRDLWYRLRKEGEILFSNKLLVNLDSIEGSRHQNLAGNRTRYWNFIVLHSRDIEQYGVHNQVMAAYHANFAIGNFLQQNITLGLRESLRGAKYSLSVIFSRHTPIAMLSLITGIKYKKIICWLKKIFSRKSMGDF